MKMGAALAVIGAGYGDEGKGLATDLLTRMMTENGKIPLVARGNGGTQAGHTVVDGARRHVFGHVGSGTFAGANTYLGSNFIVNPELLHKELGVLAGMNAHPTIFANRNCRVTTIFDMAINSLAELARGRGRHGSCGMGINETVTRHRAGHWLTLGMLMTEDVYTVSRILEKIVSEWVPERLKILGIDDDEKFNGQSIEVQEKASLYKSMFYVDRINLANEMRKAAKAIQLDDVKSVIDPRTQLIVENAQGLAIDEYLGDFPYVTRSVTGLASSIAAAYECGHADVQPIYVTRAYSTRHGAGPLPFEGVKITDKELNDTTNVSNEWQGDLRYAPLDIDTLKKLIAHDWARAASVAQTTGSRIGSPLVMVTCLDQLGESVKIVTGGLVVDVQTDDLCEIVEQKLQMDVVFKSYGPAATDVVVTKPAVL